MIDTDADHHKRAARALLQKEKEAPQTTITLDVVADLVPARILAIYLIHGCDGMEKVSSWDLRVLPGSERGKRGAESTEDSKDKT